MLPIDGNINIRNLSFTYNNKINILNNINLDINKSKKVLLLGKSGSGKSTLLKLLYRYYDVPRNSIFINNYDILDYNLLDIRKNIAYISQNEFIFTGSVRDNIILDRDISESEFLLVCKLTYVSDIVKDNPLSYDMPLEENGVNISGGQRQRIILARTILKKSKIIMIDEGLNEIDVSLERKILKNMFMYLNNCIFIIISHRIDNLDLYNQVIRLDNGIMKGDTIKDE